MERIKANSAMYFVAVLASITIGIVGYNTHRLDQAITSMQAIDRGLARLSQQVEDGKAARIATAEKTDREIAEIKSTLKSILADLARLELRNHKIEQKIGL